MDQAKTYSYLIDDSSENTKNKRHKKVYCKRKLKLAPEVDLHSPRS